jgi:hypothetical protein
VRISLNPDCASTHLTLGADTRAVGHQHEHVIESPVKGRRIRLGDEQSAARRYDFVAVSKNLI